MNETRKRAPVDLVMLSVMLGVLFGSHFAGRVAGVNSEFLNGFGLGLGIVTAISSIVVFGRRAILGKAMPSPDERQRLIKGKAAIVAVASMAIGILVFVFAAMAIPSLRSVDTVLVATGGLTFLLLAFVVGQLAYSLKL